MLKVMLGNILLKFVDLLCITMCHLALKMYQMFVVVEIYQILFVCYIIEYCTRLVIITTDHEQSDEWNGPNSSSTLTTPWPCEELLAPSQSWYNLSTSEEWKAW